jgi:hypothetical protein
MKSLVLFLMAGAACFGGSVAIKSFSEAGEELGHADGETLVVFDVDEVLIAPADIAYRMLVSHRFEPKAASSITKEERLVLAGILATQAKYALVEPAIPEMMQQLHRQGAKTIALTACGTGRLDPVPNLEEWRADHLAELGILFSEREVNHTFSGLVSAPGNPPALHKGILFLGDFQGEGRSTKGDLLVAYFDLVGWRPKKVLFFDDREHNLVSVESALEKKGIACCSYLYEGAHEMPGQLDQNLGEFQFKHLVENKEWLSDAEAKEFFSRQG